jgi:hypothetical protein
MSWLIGLLLAFQLTVLATRADALGDEVAVLKLNLRQFRPLSSNELRLVVDLAHRAGLKRVATIAAADGRWPESHGSLVVGSDEVVSGRRISQYTVEVRAEPFAPGGDRLGKFSIDSRERPWESYNATFTIRGKPMRLSCNSDLDLVAADRAFSALEASRITYSTDNAKANAATMDFTAPLNFSNKGHKVFMAFKNKDRGRIDFIEGKLKKNQLVIEVASHFDSY